MNPDQSPPEPSEYRRHVKSSNEERRSHEETEERRQTPAGRYEKKTVTEETVESSTKRTETYETGPLDAGGQTSIPEEGPGPGNGSGAENHSKPETRPESEDGSGNFTGHESAREERRHARLIADSSLPSDWVDHAPEQIRVSISGVQPSPDEEAPDFDGDYILDLIDRRAVECRWEYTFRSRCGLYRVCVVGRGDGAGGVLLRTRLEGSVPGPEWTCGMLGEFVGANVQVFDRNVAGNPCASCRWPEQVYISPLYSVPFSDLERRSEFEASRSAGFPLMGIASMADSAPPPPAPVTYYSSGGGGTGCTPGSSINSDGTCKPYEGGDLCCCKKNECGCTDEEGPLCPGDTPGTLGYKGCRCACDEHVVDPDGVPMDDGCSCTYS